MIAVVALSARAAVQAAAAEGIRCVALDVFGDADTCRHADEWHDIGAAADDAAPAIDGRRLRSALQRLSRRGDVSAWVFGSGLEHRPALLEACAALLPLAGTAPDDVRRARDPAGFFGALAALSMPHPPVSFVRPSQASGWLRKHADASGGLGVTRAGAGDADGPTVYWQRECTGRPMSATFVADGRDAELLSVNEMLLQPSAAHPFAFGGIVGPLPAGERLRAAMRDAVRRLAQVFALRGLGSLDAIVQGDEPAWLELNPRLSASLALLPLRAGRGAIGLHLAACAGELPAPPPRDAPVRGILTVRAPRALAVDEALASRLAALAHTCDLPRPGTRCAAGGPLCSVLAESPDADATRQALAQRSDAVLKILENCR